MEQGTTFSAENTAAPISRRATIFDMIATDQVATESLENIIRGIYREEGLRLAEQDAQARAKFLGVSTQSVVRTDSEYGQQKVTDLILRTTSALASILMMESISEQFAFVQQCGKTVDLQFSVAA